MDQKHPAEMTLLLADNDSKPSRPRWKRSVLLFSIFGFVVFGVNLAGAVWATVKGSNGMALLSAQDCSGVKTKNTLIHVLINVLSSILLSGSNFCMQVLMAPTRKQIDKAHASKSWIDVGIPSIRNFDRMLSIDRIFWLAICFSSIPLHLFYNSVVFTTTSVSSDYYPWIVPQGYIDTLDSIPTDNIAFLEDNPGFAPVYLNLAYKKGRLTRLTTKECIDEYAISFQSDWSDLFVVTDGPGTTPSGRLDMADYDNSCGGKKEIYQWVCSGFTTGATRKGATCFIPCEDRLPAIRKNSTDTWKFYGEDVQYCLSMPVHADCKLQASTVLLWFVTCTSLVKAILFSILALRSTNDRILTIGDAIASFLKHPDATTEGACFLTKKEVEKNQNRTTATRERPLPFDKGERPFLGKRKRGFAAASPIRWCASIILYILSIAICLGFLAFGISGQKGQVKTSTMFAWGLGALRARATVVYGPDMKLRGSAGIILMSVIANLPQILLSFIYFTYNGLFTALSEAREWSNFGRERKGLRISSRPVGEQRSDYFLQLPYRFSVPLILLSILTHWLVGQSLFLVAIEVYSPRNPDYSQPDFDEPIHSGAVWNGDEITTGWSPLGLVLTTLTGTLMIAILLIVARRQLPTSMPVVASCSLAMSAACHTIPYEPEAWKKKVMWGVTDGSIDDGSGIAHCSFTSASDVEYPTEGEMYK